MIVKANFLKRISGAFIFDFNRNLNNTRRHPWYYSPIACVWWGLCLPLNVLDGVGLFKLFDRYLNQSTSRTLTVFEIKEIEKVYGTGSVSRVVRVVENAWLAKLGAKYKGAKHLGFVLFNHIYFSRKIEPETCLADMAWLIHEMVHIKQYETVGFSYIIKALRAQRYGGYIYQKKWLKSALKDFNFEQQGELAKHFYLALKAKQNTTDYQKIIEAIRTSQF